MVEYEQGGKARSERGKDLLNSLSHDLSLRHGKGFSRSNLIRFRQFYFAFPKGAALSHLLSWSHIVELLNINDPLERDFYQQQAVAEHWSGRERPVCEAFRQPSGGRDSLQTIAFPSAGRLAQPPRRVVHGPVNGGVYGPVNTTAKQTKQTLFANL